MSESKVTASHLRRVAVVYVRQSTLAQISRNRESTTRQYDLAARAAALGWPAAAVRVIDEDLGVSGASAAGRSGFAELAAQVGLGQVGIVLALEVSRLARNNADWYRLLDLAGMTDTLIADADGVYHPGLFNDRMLLGMKGTMSEAELHILRARLDGGIRSKAARGELRRGLPVGLVWGEADGEIRKHPDEAVTGVITAIFERFPVSGSVRGVWLWLREQGLKFPLQPAAYLRGGDIVWVEPTYHAVHNVLTHPAYAGAYVFGKTRQRRRVDPDGVVRVSRHKLPQGEWEVLITDHHEGFIDWNTFQDNQSRIGANIRPTAHQPGTGAVREGCALLQGLATCGTCGRKLAVYYDGPAKTTPGYYCTGTGQLVEGRGTRHLRVGGVGIDAAVAAAFLAALQPAALQACLTAAEQLEDGHDAALEQWRRQLEQARYQAGRAERRYRAVDPDNRLVARGLESEWNTALQQVADAETELARREAQRPKTLTPQEKSAILALGDNLDQVWSAPSTTDRDRKQLLRSLLDEVNITVARDTDSAHAELVLRWKGGAITELSVPIKRTPANRLRTDEDTIDLVRRLAVHYPDAMIAHILNRQDRRTARGLSFTAGRVQTLRHHWNIACHKPGNDPQEGELLTVADAAEQLGLAPSTLHRWLGDGFIAGEQLTPGAPWRIRLTHEVRALFVDTAPEGWLAMLEATLAYGVSRQTIMHRVKTGELQAVHVRTGRRKGLRIQPPPTQEGLF
ncbi:recombinase family protein [Nocardia vinacea]|uniref:recombinase family protein n=1 Tax=Nocardia vinacea TaxID=96468 RepID=UPI0033FCF99B